VIGPATGGRSRSARRVAWTLAAAATVAAGPFALAQQPAKPPKPAAPPSASASAAPAAPPRGGAILRLAAELAQGLGAVPAGTLVATGPLVSDVASPKGDELALRLVTQLAGRLGTAQVHPQPATLPVARGLSGRAASLVWVQVEIAKGELRATADLYPVVSNGWERLRNPVPGPRAHAFASAPLDAEVRTFLPPIVLEQASVHRTKHEEQDVLAIGCGDVDADGGLEIVVVSRSRVVLGKLRGGKLAITKAAPWTQLASRVPVPLREPIATVLVSPPGHRGEILLGITDRGGVAVDGALVPRRQLTGLPVPGADGDACALPSPENHGLDGVAVACVPPPKGDPPPVFTPPSPRYDALGVLSLVAKDGTANEIAFARDPAGKLRLRRSDAPPRAQETPVDNVGAQVALADLDLDGTPELAFSSSSSDAADDTLGVWSWRANGLVQRLKVPTKEAVRAIGACPPEEKGAPALVAVIGAEIWLVR
jgi:hypothetical protein